MMRVLVTGATGRVGSRLVPRLLQNGYSVRVLVRNEEQGETFRRQGAEAALDDLLKPASLAQAVAGVDGVVHLAAFFRGASEAKARLINVDGARALARAAQEAGVARFVYISTNLVYGHGRGRLARESDEPQPLLDNFYPTGKLAAEGALEELYRSKPETLAILRLAFVYGENDPHLTEAVGWARNWPRMKRLHMVHHADVAQAIQLALDKPEAGGRIYNVADDEPITAAEILTLNNLTTNGMNDTPPEDPWEGIVDTTRIRDELGFHPIYPSVNLAKKAGAL